MQSLYYKAFNYIDNARPGYLGIYFSLFFHLFILLFAIGLPDFFKPNKIPMPQIIPIEILNISDVTTLAPKKEGIEINKNKIKKVEQKKFNASDNTEIQKIDIQEKPKKNLIQNEKIPDNTFIAPNVETKKVKIKEKKINNLKEEKINKLENLETLEINKIKPKLKPKPIEQIKSVSDIDIESKPKPEIKKIEQKKIIDKPKPEIKKNEQKKVIDKPKPVEKPEPDFNIASVLKDLRNEEVSNVIEEDNKEEEKLENKEEESKELDNLEVSISEMDLVIQQLRSCFNPRAGTQIVGDEMVKISAKIDKAANVRKDTVQIIDTNISKSNPYYEAITESAVATLYNPLCAKLKLPLEKYDSWKDLKIIIDYSWIKN